MTEQLHTVTRALNNLVSVYKTKTVAEWLNTSPANVSRNSRGGKGYENGPHINHELIRQLHRDKFPNGSGWLT